MDGTCCLASVLMLEKVVLEGNIEVLFTLKGESVSIEVKNWFFPWPILPLGQLLGLDELILLGNLCEVVAWLLNLVIPASHSFGINVSQSLKLFVQSNMDV